MPIELTDEQHAALLAEAEAGKTAATALEAANATIETTRAAGVTALTEALRTGNADLPADAIAGATIEEVTASVARARSIADHVKTNAAAPAPAPAPATAATAHQAGAPARDDAPNTDGLRGTERIRAALDAKKE